MRSVKAARSMSTATKTRPINQERALRRNRRAADGEVDRGGEERARRRPFLHLEAQRHERHESAPQKRIAPKAREPTIAACRPEIESTWASEDRAAPNRPCRDLAPGRRR